jgi:integrase
LLDCPDGPIQAAPNAGRAAAGERAAFAQYEVVVYVLAYCGLRWGELAALRVSSVDLLRGRLEIAESVVEDDGRLLWGVPKTHERRSVPLPEFVADMLDKHIVGMGPNDILFTGIRSGGVLRNRIFRRSTFDRAAREVGQVGLVPKDLRHTAASLAISAGANVKAVQRMLGHASAAMTLDTYADLFDDDLDAVANRLHLAAATAREVVADQMRTRPRSDAVVVDLQDAAGQ